MLNKYDKELISNFVIILISTLLIITVVVIFSNLTKKTKNINFRDYFIKKVLPPIFCIFLILFVYDSFKLDNNKLMLYFFAFFIEILSISFAIGKKRENAIFKLIGIVFFWVVIGIICFSITGFFEQYLGYKELKESNLRLLFTAIFYHLLNACFLFYSSLPEYMTKKLMKSRLKKSHNQDIVILLIKLKKLDELIPMEWRKEQMEWN